MNRGFVSVVLVIALVIIGAGVWLYMGKTSSDTQESNNELSGSRTMKTYSDSRHGFTLQYSDGQTLVTGSAAAGYDAGSSFTTLVAYELPPSDTLNGMFFVETSDFKEDVKDCLAIKEGQYISDVRTVNINGTDYTSYVYKRTIDNAEGTKYSMSRLNRAIRADSCYIVGYNLTSKTPFTPTYASEKISEMDALIQSVKFSAI